MHPADRRAPIDLEADPFGPYEYVEPGERCYGAEGHCMWSQCTQRDSTCRCCCPVCVDDDLDTWGYDGPN